jgi:hypothetical protein
MLRTAEWSGAVGVLWNGQDLGGISARDICDALDVDTSAGSRTLAIHSLLGQNIDEVLAIIKSANLFSGYFWLHDFTSLCAGVHLMRNDVADCGAPAAASPACGICIYGPYRNVHVAAHEKLFSALDLTVVAPAQVTMATWQAGTSLVAAATLTHPHASLMPAGLAKTEGGGRLKVAFLGVPALHKGWPTFLKLAARFADDQRYSFIHLASVQVRDVPVDFHDVTVSAEAPFAMRDAMAQLDIDVALIWSLCRETFSFGTYDAASVGALILTNPDSGNVAAFASDPQFGQVLASEAELIALFETGAASGLAKSVRNPMAYDLAFSALTMDLVAAP